MKRIFLLAIFGMALAASAQNWSPPVQLTDGWGDDADLDVQYNWADNSWWVAWTHTDSINSEIYHAFFNPWTLTFDQVRRLTFRPEADEKPSIAYGMVDLSGVFFQSFHEGRRAIYFVVENDTGFSSPWLTLYSDANLYEPDYSPLETDFGGVTIPALFLRSDSAAVAVRYDELCGYSIFEVPPDTAFNVNILNSGFPVHSHDGEWQSAAYFGISWQHFAWEKQIEGRGEIEYYFQILDTNLWIETFTGLLPNAAYSYHQPVLALGGYGIHVVRESQTGSTDLAMSAFSPSTGEWTVPYPIYGMSGNERNINEDWDYSADAVVFENDSCGDWNVVFWNLLLGQPEYVDTNPHDDVNPIVRIIDDQYFVFWVSGRTGSYKIYCSYKPVLGIEQKPTPMPGKFALSIHPNPSNAEFRIDLDLPVTGEVNAAIYDLSGRRVAMIHNGIVPAGSQQLSWDASEIASGIYLLRVACTDNIQTRKMVVLK